MSISPDIADDDELKSRVRNTTLYPDDVNEGLTNTELTAHIANAKLRLSNEGVDNFYADHGVQQALLYATMIESKLSIENYSVTRWDIPAGSIDVSGAGESDQAQFQQWANNVSQGLHNSTETSGSEYPTGINSTSFIH